MLKRKLPVRSGAVVERDYSTKTETRTAVEFLGNGYGWFLFFSLRKTSTDVFDVFVFYQTHLVLILYLRKFLRILSLFLAIYLCFFKKWNLDINQPKLKNRIKKSGQTSQSVFTFSKLTIETLEQGVEYVQS